MIDSSKVGVKSPVIGMGPRVAVGLAERVAEGVAVDVGLTVGVMVGVILGVGVGVLPDGVATKAGTSPA